LFPALLAGKIRVLFVVELFQTGKKRKIISKEENCNNSVIVLSIENKRLSYSLVCLEWEGKEGGKEGRREGGWKYETKEV